MERNGGRPPPPRGNGGNPRRQGGNPQPWRRDLTAINVSKEIKTWSDFFKDDKVDNDSRLDQIDVEVVEDTIIYPEEEAVANAKRWSNTLAGYIVGLRPHIPTLESHLRRLWGLQGKMEALARGRSSFILRFEKEDELKIALEQGPWFVRGKPMLLKRWESGEPLEQERLEEIPIWMKLHNIPLELWDMKMFSRIGSHLGRPLCADRLTSSCKRLDAARICVLMSAKSRFQKTINLGNGQGKRHEIQIEYEWIPSVCKHCCTFAHEEDLCVDKPEIKKKNDTDPIPVDVQTPEPTPPPPPQHDPEPAVVPSATIPSQASPSTPLPVTGFSTGSRNNATDDDGFTFVVNRKSKQQQQKNKQMKRLQVEGGQILTLEDDVGDAGREPASRSL